MAGSAVTAFRFHPPIDVLLDAADADLLALLAARDRDVEDHVSSVVGDLFRYVPSVETVLRPGGVVTAETVALLADRDRQLEDFLSNPASGGGGGGTITYAKVGSVTQPNLGVSPQPLCAQFDASGMVVYAWSFDSVDTTDVINVYDVSDPTNPTLSTTIDGFGFGVGGMCVANDHLFLGMGSGSAARLRVYDITSPLAPSFVTSFDPGLPVSARLTALVAQGNYVYAHRTNTGTRALIVFDVSTPASPSTVSTTTGANAGQYPRSLAVAGDRLLLGSGTGPQLWDISNPAAPSLLATGPTNVAPGVALNSDATWGFANNDASTFSFEAFALDAMTQTDTAQDWGSRAWFYDNGYIVSVGDVVVDVTAPPAASLAAAGTGGFNVDWASDYNAARKLTACFTDADTARLDIGQVVGIPTGWNPATYFRYMPPIELVLRPGEPFADADVRLLLDRDRQLEDFVSS